MGEVFNLCDLPQLNQGGVNNIKRPIISGERERGSVNCYWDQCKVVQILRKSVWQFLKKLGIDPPQYHQATNLGTDNSDLPKQGYTGASSTNTGVIKYFLKLDLRFLHEMEPLSDNGRRAKNLRLDSWSLAQGKP